MEASTCPLQSGEKASLLHFLIINLTDNLKLVKQDLR